MSQISERLLVQAHLDAKAPAPLSDAEKKECFACFDTEDFRTGYQAFLDKKKPEFKGR